MDEKRVQRLQQDLTTFATIHDHVLPIMSICVQDMQKHAAAVDHVQVRLPLEGTRLFVVDSALLAVSVFRP